MARSDEEFYIAVSRIENGEDADLVAVDVGVSKATVLRWKREYAEAKQTGTLSDLVDVDRMVIHKAGELLKLPVEGIAKKLDNHQKLNDELQIAALAIISQVKSTVLSSEHISELNEAAEIICNIQTAFFAKGTQVNVQNNYDGSSKYGSFLDDKPSH